MDSKRWFTFMLRDELDMLEMQLYEHYDYIHRFILVEAPISHTGNPKPLYYADNKERFAQYSDKIIHVIANDLPTKEQNPDPWCREQAQRDAGMPYFMPDTDNDDVIVIMDIDEIATREALEQRPQPVLGLNLKLRFAAVDWYGTEGVNGVTALASYVNFVGSVDKFRQQRDQFPVYQNAGWHFSWLGGKDVIDTKVKSFCHQEAFNEVMEVNATDSMYRLGVSWPGAGYGTPCEVDETYPKWIYERKCPANWFRPRGDADLPEELR